MTDWRWETKVSTAALVAVVAGPIYAELREHPVGPAHGRKMAVREAFELVREAQRVVESADEEGESE